MKKNKRQGFTLIELLAVITIMGILMLIAIPAVSRTIENSRKNTFATLGKQYISTVRNAVLADELKCNLSDTVKDVQVGSVPDGKYYFKISTVPGSPSVNQTTQLMEKVGKSPWAGADVQGYVSWEKTGDKTKYKILLVDTARHGITTPTEENSITRTSVLTDNTAYVAARDKTEPVILTTPQDSKYKECKLA